MRIQLHLIDINIPARRIHFDGRYHPNKGPLPQASYTLAGAWVYKEKLIKAVWQARDLPSQDGELILHRYEGPSITQPTQANYRYFVAPGYAGMVLNNQAYGKMGLPVMMAWQHMDTQANRRLAQAWLAELDPAEQSEVRLVEVHDQYNNFGSVVLSVKENSQP